MGKVKLIIFDLDQTLIDTFHRFFDVFNETLKAYNLEEIDLNTFSRLYKEDKLNDLIPEHINKKEFWIKFRRLYSSFENSKDSLIAGVPEVLEFLRSKGYTIVVTTGREANPEQIKTELDKFKIGDFADFILTLAQQNPSEEEELFSRAGILRQILQKYNVKKEEVVFVGDYWVDMDAGKKVGIFTIGVLTGHEPEEKLYKYGASLVIPSVAHLPKVLKKIENEN